MNHVFPLIHSEIIWSDKLKYNLHHIAWDANSIVSYQSFYRYIYLLNALVTVIPSPPPRGNPGTLGTTAETQTYDSDTEYLDTQFWHKRL